MNENRLCIFDHAQIHQKKLFQILYFGKLLICARKSFITSTSEWRNSAEKIDGEKRERQFKRQLHREPTTTSKKPFSDYIGIGELNNR